MARGIESKLQDKFINKLKEWNILYLKTTGGLSYLPDGKGSFRPIMSKKGFADVIVFLQDIDNENCQYCYKDIPLTLFIEIKTDDGKLRESQIEKFNELKKLGFDCFVLRPKHWDESKRVAKIDHCKLSFNYLLNEMEVY